MEAPRGTPVPTPGGLERCRAGSPRVSWAMVRGRGLFNPSTQTGHCMSETQSWAPAGRALGLLGAPSQIAGPLAPVPLPLPSSPSAGRGRAGRGAHGRRPCPCGRSSIRTPPFSPQQFSAGSAPPAGAEPGGYPLPMARSERRGAGTEAAGRRPHGRLGVRASGRPGVRVSVHAPALRPCSRSTPWTRAPAPDPPLRAPRLPAPRERPPRAGAERAEAAETGVRGPASGRGSPAPANRGLAALCSRGSRAPLASAVPRGCLGLGPGASAWALFLPRVAGVQGSVSAAQSYTKFRAGVSGLAAQCSPAPSVPSFGADTHV